MIKKNLLFLAFLFLLVNTISAENLNLDISLPKEKFGIGENIGIQIILKDFQENKINKELEVIFEDSLKNQIIKKIQTNTPTIITLGETPTNGMWKISTTYEDKRAISWFLVEENENATLKLDGDMLTVTNTGNTVYSKTINIIIGEKLSSKKVTLDIGKSASLRIIAPEGVYNLKITDGITTISKADVILTGDVIGILDENFEKSSLITTTNLEDIKSGDYSFLKKGNFAYIFIMVVVGATILLAIEKHYRQKTK